MAAGPVQAFTRDSVKARWAERYTSDAINKKFLGLPRGVYLGFIPSAAGLVLSLVPDKVVTFSSLTGAFSIGATLTGPSGTAVIRAISAGFLLVSNVTGTFLFGEAISDGSATATVETFVEEDVSFGRVVSSSTLAGGRSEHMLDVFTTDTITLDFTGFADGVYYVILTASYEVGVTTTGSILTRTTPPPSGAQEVLICRITKVGASITTVEASAPATRHEPTAFEGQRNGFMPGGSVENLVAAITGTAEVIAARRLSDGTTAPAFLPGSPQTTGLPFRLNNDLSNVSMASRLGKRLISVQGNDFTLTAPVTSFNVSSAFGARNRDFEPFRDQSPATGIAVPAGVPVAIEPDGDDFVELTLTGVIGSFSTGLLIQGDTSGATAVIKTVVGSVLTVGDFIGDLFAGEGITQAAPLATGTISTIDLKEGAITGLSGGPAADQNIVMIIDDSTGNKAIDTSANAVTVFGRLIYGPGGGGAAGELTLGAGKTLDFVAGGTNVSATGTPLAIPSDVDVGDLVEGADGRFYEVEVATPANLTLPATKDYVGPTVIGSASRRRRRFLLEFRRVVAGVEGAATLAAGTYRFFFPAWFTMEKSNFDATHNASAAGGTEVPRATTSVEGRVIAATGSPTPAQAGAFNVFENAGTPLATGGPIHTINWLGGGATSPGAGQVDIPAGVGQGKLLQMGFVSAQTTVAASGPLVLWDDTIPQDTEGASVISLPFTPTAASSNLVIMWSASIGGVPGQIHIAWLAEQTVADAHAASFSLYNATFGGAHDFGMAVNHVVPAVNTAARTYEIRVGNSGGSTSRVGGGSDSLNKFNGKNNNTLIILEIAP